MDKETEQRALKALEQQRKRYKYQNDYIKGSYDRVSVTLPKGTKNRITETGETVNGLINRLVREYLENYTNE